MNELIMEFNTDKTHVELDTINQFENDMSTTYTAYLIDNETGEPVMGAVSIDNFKVLSWVKQ